MKKNGFSLLEVICVLLLLGILASMATIGISRTVSQFNFTRERVAQSQKAQVVFNRLLIEFTHFDAAGTAGTFDIGSSSGSTVYYYPAIYSGTPERDAFSYDSNNAVLKWNGNVLCDEVTSFTMTPIPNPATASTLKSITVSMQLEGLSDAITSTIAIKNLNN